MGVPCGFHAAAAAATAHVKHPGSGKTLLPGSGTRHFTPSLFRAQKLGYASVGPSLAMGPFLPSL